MISRHHKSGCLDDQCWLPKIDLRRYPIMQSKRNGDQTNSIGSTHFASHGWTSIWKVSGACDECKTNCAWIESFVCPIRSWATLMTAYCGWVRQHPPSTRSSCKCGDDHTGFVIHNSRPRHLFKLITMLMWYYTRLQLTRTFICNYNLDKIWYPKM